MSGHPQQHLLLLLLLHCQLLHCWLLRRQLLADFEGVPLQRWHEQQQQQQQPHQDLMSPTQGPVLRHWALEVRCHCQQQGLMLQTSCWCLGLVLLVALVLLVPVVLRVPAALLAAHPLGCHHLIGAPPSA